MKKTIILKLISIILILNSCQESKYKEAIVDSYKKNAAEKNITLKISNIDILEQYNAGDEYFQELIIKDLNSVISDSRRIIRLFEENISIYNQSIKEKSESGPAYNSMVIDSFKIEIRKAKAQITTIKTNIIEYQEELKKTTIDYKSSKSELKFLIVKHYLEAELNDTKINDTIHCIFDSKMNFLEFNPNIFDIDERTPTYSNVYNQLLSSCLLGISTGSFSFANFVPVSATNRTRTP
ncbi:MAG: hypothetical protein Aureis2KO_08100 [Aureisphaera sp.]